MRIVNIEVRIPYVAPPSGSDRRGKISDEILKVVGVNSVEAYYEYFVNIFIEEVLEADQAMNIAKVAYDEICKICKKHKLKKSEEAKDD